MLTGEEIEDWTMYVWCDHCQLDIPVEEYCKGDTEWCFYSKTNGIGEQDES